MSQKPQNDFWVIMLIVIALAMLLSMMSCNSVKKSQSSSKTETITVIVRDTVHVKVIDTSKITTELQEFITKTIEIFDTTYTEVPQIRQRIIYENVKKQNTTAQVGITKDSSAGKVNSIQSQTIATDSKSKQTNRTPWYLLLGIVIIVLYYLTVKKFNILK